MLLLLLAMAIVKVQSDQGADKNISWNSYAGGIDFAAILTGKKDTPGGLIMLYVKNTSSSARKLLVSPKTDQGFLIYVVGNAGVKTLLHDRDPSHGKSRIQEIAASMGSYWSEQINPGETISRGIRVSPSDLALIEANSVQYSFSVVDASTGQSYKIETAPETLSVER